MLLKKSLVSRSKMKHTDMKYVLGSALLVAGCLTSDMTVAQCPPDPSWSGGTICSYTPLDDLGLTGANTVIWSGTGGVQFSSTSVPTPTITNAPGPFNISVNIDGVPCGPWQVTVADVTASLSADWNGSPLPPIFDYGAYFPTFALCGQAPPGTLVLADQTTGGDPFSVDWGNGSTTLPPGSQQFSAGLTTIEYVAMSDVGQCYDTAQYGVLIGPILTTPFNCPTSGFGVNEFCLENGTVNYQFQLDSGCDGPEGTIYLVYSNLGDPTIPIDTLFAPITNPYSISFTSSSCGSSAGAYQNSFYLLTVPTYGCYQGPPSNASAAQPIRISQPPQADFTPAPIPDLCVDETITFVNTSSGQWVDVLPPTNPGFASVCAGPVVYWGITPATYTVVAGTLGSNSGSPTTPSLWIPGSNTLSVEFDAPGNYTVTIYAGGSDECPVDDQPYAVCVEAPVTNVDFNLSGTEFCLNGQVQVTSTNSTPLVSECSDNTFAWAPDITALCGPTAAPVFTNPGDAEPTIIFSAPGVYEIHMSADNLGCDPVDAEPVVVTVYEAPSVNLPATSNACDGAPFDFDASPYVTICDLGSAYAWSSDPDLGITDSDLQLTGLAISAPTTLTLTVTPSTGPCPIVVGSMTVSPSVTPVADAGPDITACPTQPLQLNTAAAGADNYAWLDPNGVEVANSPTPTPLPLPVSWLPGTYTLVASIGDCESTDDVVVTAVQAPVLPPIPPQVICPPSVVSVDLQATGADSFVWTWDNGNGTFNGPTLTVTTGMNGPFTVVGTNTGPPSCSSDPVEVTVANVSVDAEFGFLPPFCAGSDIQFNDQSLGTASAWFWDFGTGQPGDISTEQNPVFNYTDPGTYTVTLTVNPNSGCSDTQTNQIVIDPSPNVNFTVNQSSGCNNDLFDLQIDVIQTGVTYEWFANGVSFFQGGTPPPQTFPSIQAQSNQILIELAATTANCGQVTDSEVITILPDPSAFLGFSYDADNPCSPLSVTFFNNSLANDAVEDILDFGDGSAVVTPFPNGAPVVHEFTTGSTPTTYTVTLQTFNDCGDSTTTVDITVQPASITAFFEPPSDTCAGAVVCVSSPVQGATSWNWQFGDGSTSTLESACHTYTASGTYVITLAVDGICGSDVWTDTIVFFPVPVSTITAVPLAICLGEGIVFTGAPADMSSYGWNFGDGGVSDMQELEYTYSSPFNGNVTLQVTDTNGCQAITTTTIVVNPLPIPILQPFDDSLCVPFTITLDASASANADQFAWDLGNEQSSPLGSTTTQYDTAGTYWVSLVITSNSGCSDSTSFPIIGLPVPHPMFQTIMPDPCASPDAPVTVTFVNQSTGGGGFLWDFGNGTSSTSSDPSTIYVQPGEYTVSLVDSNAFCGNSHDTTLAFFPEPEAAFSIATAPLCTQQFFPLINLSEHLINYQWGLNNTVFSDAPAPILQIASAGSYTILLTGTGSGDCVDTASATIEVCESPDAAFTLSSVIGPSVEFINHSNGATSYIWYFGDGDAVEVSDANPITHAYFKGNLYCNWDVALVAVNDCGCRDTAVVRDLAMPIRIALTPANAFSPNGDNNPLKNETYRLDYVEELAGTLRSANYHFQIFDKWNTAVFDSTNPLEEWDGTYNGRPVETGSYNWLLSMKPWPCVATDWPHQGRVSVVR